MNINALEGKPVELPNYPIKSIQVVGTFGGATVTIEGSNMVLDNVLELTYAPQVDNLETAITFTSTGIKQIFSNTYWIRPRISSGGNVNTDIDVYLIAHTMR